MLAWGERTYLMGIVNVTPDSFSGDGEPVCAAAVRHALGQCEAGADIVDIGGESTRPGHLRIEDAKEIARVVPVIAGVRKALPKALISVDTYKPAVLRAAHAAGASLVNSVWGLPEALLEVVAELSIPVVIMHNRSQPLAEGSILPEVLAELSQAARRALARGIPRACIILDPGIGFGKTPEQNVELLAHLRELRALGFPTMLGASRKSTLGKLTGRSRPQDRVSASVATSTLAAAAGIDIVRVHDLAAHRDALCVADAVQRGWRPVDWIA